MTSKFKVQDSRFRVQNEKHEARNPQYDIKTENAPHEIRNSKSEANPKTGAQKRLRVSIFGFVVSRAP